MRGHSYDSRNNNPERNRSFKKQMHSNSHFLSLQCILDKYQHENSMLSQQVKLLLNQNKRLRAKPGVDSFQQVDYGQRVSKKQYENTTRERSKTLYNFAKQVESNSFNFNNKSKDRSNYQMDQKQRKSSERQKKNVYQEDNKPGRKYSYLPQQRKSANSQITPTTTYFRQNNGRNMNAQTYLKDFSGMEKSGILNIQRKCLPTFTCQVYLDEETIFIDDDTQKLPCFVQPSFGNIDLKISNCQNLEAKKNSQVSQSEVKNSISSKIKQPIFKLGKKQNQNEQVKKTNFNSQEIEKLDRLFFGEKEKQNIEIGSCRKTNYPYIKNQFKISEPKTQLTNIFYPERTKQQKQPESKPKNCRDKRIFLNVLSKAPKKSMFSK